MKHPLFLILLLIIAISTPVAGSALGFANETLNYVVSYKWGLIHKDAGTATLSLRNYGDSYHIQLTARSKPWADKIYKVRDTLVSTVAHNGFKPLSYTRIAHEDGKYSRDDIAYTYNGRDASAKCLRTRTRKGKTSITEKMLAAQGAAYDMLSVFYFLRLIDYASLRPGQIVVTTLFSGKETETVRIKPVSTEIIRLRDKTKAEAYHIRFNFTSAGKKKSSDDIDAWISTAPGHIPLLVVGSLPVGQIKCYFTGRG